MKLKITAASVTLMVALAGFLYEIVWGGGRATVISGCVTLILVTPAQALDAYRRGRAITSPPPEDKA